jgi:type II secretory ATPase GspE/PulE/Tfp pilus assembly ATPase PilB-like protein
MIGEIRDTETAQTAVHAANSGHLILATVHAATATGAIQSMRSLGVHPHFLATSLRGIISQRLLRTLCPCCKVSFDLTTAPETFQDVQPMLEAGEGTRLFAPKGCPDCHQSGYAGRTGIFEVLSVTRSLRDLISDARPAREIRARATADGLLEFRSAALLKVARGQTSTEEIFRVLPAEHLLLEE